jgi:hypothetical protein
VGRNHRPQLLDQDMTATRDPDVRNDHPLRSLVHEVLNSEGRPLDPDTRALMEPRFGHDFSKVQVHTDSRASASAHAVNAEAYTVGLHLVFADGRFAPRTIEGLQLLAHELTHVLQQGHGREGEQELTLGQPGDSHEVEAERVASKVIRPEHPASTSRGRRSFPHADRPISTHPHGPTPTIQRKIPTGATLKEAKPFGHSDLKTEEHKKKFLTNIGTVSLMQLTPSGDYTEGQKRGECTREFLTEVSNTCPATHDFCSNPKCLEVGRFGTSGDPPTGNQVTDGPDSFIDRHVTRMGTSFLESSGKDKCSVVCHQRYEYRTEPDKKYHPLSSFYIIRNFKADTFTPTGSNTPLKITTGNVQKVPAAASAPSAAGFAKDIAPGLEKSGTLLEAPPTP